MDTHNKITRRKFLGNIVAGTTAAVVLPHHTAVSKEGTSKLPSMDVVDALPKRVLGRTRQKVTILGLGTAPVGEGPIGLQQGIRIFGEAMDRGVTYIDTARIYGNAEEILGHLIPKRRDKLFVATKVSTHTADEAGYSLSESLRRLKTDHVDLVHVHSIGSKNVDRVLGKGGAMEYLLNGFISQIAPWSLPFMDVETYVLSDWDEYVKAAREKIKGLSEK